MNGIEIGLLCMGNLNLSLELAAPYMFKNEN